MSGDTRRVIGLPLKHWWLVGGLLLCGLVAAGSLTGWSGGFLAVTAIVAAVYIGLPPMAAALPQQPAGRSLANPPAPSAGGGNRIATGGTVAWDTRMNPVVHALARAISDQRIIRDIATRSGLSMEYVGDRPDALSYWTAVLERAQDEGDQKADAVLHETLIRTENQAVHDAVEAYWKAR